MYPFLPKNYNLKLTLDREGRTFAGEVVISGESKHETKSVVLNSKDLKIHSAKVGAVDGSWTHGDKDELTITFPEALSGQYELQIEFSGDITDTMNGIYPCYFEHEGKKKELLATQFESHYAREAFPCIDDPGVKATFDLTLTTEKDVTVLSNMPVKTQEATDSGLVTIFEKTPKMSTYLLAWVVGELHSKSAKTKDGVEVNVWATVAQPATSLDFALESAVKTIEFFNEYFDIPYPLPKSDHVALPDFSSGAMENWGLITYREIALLADPKVSGVSSKQYIATVIAHELAHQWFGNLVTMKWWDDLWLNESFATLMEYIAVDAIHPDWNMWLEAASHENSIALNRDAIDGVQSVRTEVTHPDEISTLFDGAIVYAKGSRLMRMLQAYVGEEAFRAGLKNYFTKFAYSNTAGEDLWESLRESSGKDVSEFMGKWLSQPGYPVVHVSQKDTDTIELRQEQFFVGTHKESDRLWPIPLQSTCGEMPELLDTPALEVTRRHKNALLLNSGASSHFIVNYDHHLLSMLLPKVADKSLPAIDRLALLNDQLLLAKGGITPTANLLSILEAYKNEDDEAVWGLIASALVNFRKFVESDEKAEKALRKLSSSIARQQYDRLGWDRKNDEPEEDSKLRATILSLMIYGEDEECIQTTKRLYDELGAEAIDPEIRAVVLSAVVRHHENDEVKAKLLELYANTVSPDVSTDVCSGITSTKDEKTITDILSLMMDTKTIRPQDTVRWFVHLLRNKYARNDAWNWLKDNWGWIENTFGGDKSYDDFARYSAAVLSSREHLDEYKEFFLPMTNIPVMKRTVELGILDIEARVELIESEGPEVIRSLIEQIQR